MTTAARLVLEDCRQELLEFAEHLPASAWRRHWIALLVLLRAVGHVLDKVDGKRSPALQRAISAWWSGVNNDKAAHPLFWEFIERERNSFIKEYATSARQIVAIQVGAVNYDAKTDRQWSDPPQSTQYLQCMHSGHYAGQDQREIAREAIRWWETQLDSIDLQVRNAPA